jgi:hypothetical protein
VAVHANTGKVETRAADEPGPFAPPLPDSDIATTEFGLFKFKKLILELSTIERVERRPVQNARMPWVHRILRPLQPVAVEIASFIGDANPICPYQEIIPRKKRSLLRRSHVSKDESSELFARIGGVLNLLLKGLSLCGLVDAPAINVVRPSMINASHSSMNHASPSEIGPTMAAARANKSRPTQLIPKEDHFLAQDPHGQELLHLEIIGELYRKPVSAKDLSRGSPRTYSVKEFVLFSREHAIFFPS